MGCMRRLTNFPQLLLKLLLLLVLLLQIQVPLAAGDTANYYYDESGRLTRVIRGTAGVSYNYDALGNLVSVTSASTANGSPVISSVSPNVLFVGSKMLVNINGSNLLSTDTVIAISGLVAIGNITVTDTQITAEMTALSAGTETIRITTRNGTPNYAETNVTLSTSKLTFSPGQLALMPGESRSITVSISPPLANTQTLSLNNSKPTIVSAPQSITIPASGSANFTVNALQLGTATISAGDPRSVVFVSSPFTGDVAGFASPSVSVYLDTPSRATANPVSVYLDAPSRSAANPVSVYLDTPSRATANPVSVYLDAPSRAMANPVSVYLDAPSRAMANPVSVYLDAPSRATANPVSVYLDTPSRAMANPVSVYLDAPSPTLSGAVSVKIQ